MVPPYVERKVAGQPASVSWWVDDAMMEADRIRKKAQPTYLDAWNQELDAAGLNGHVHSPMILPDYARHA